MKSNATFKDVSCRGNQCQKFEYADITPPFDYTDVVNEQTVLDLRDKLKGVPALFVKIKTDKACNLFYSVSGNLIKDSEGLKQDVWKIYNNLFIDKIVLEPLSTNTRYYIYATTLSPVEFENLIKTMQVPPTMIAK